jgi:hypothetical protein
MSIYTPYTYLIGWSHLNKWYYGVRYATKTHCLYESGCHPEDLWTTYFSSSKIVKKYRKIYGEPDVIQVRKTFMDAESAIQHEQKVLTRLKIHEEKWLNQANQKAIFLDELTREEISKKLSGRPSNMKGKKHTKEAKEKMSKAKIGKSNTSLRGKNLSEDHKKKLKIAKIGYIPWNKGKTKKDYPSLQRKGTNKGIKRGKRITNGTINRFLKDNETIPDGFWFGMAPRNKK